MRRKYDNEMRLLISGKEKSDMCLQILPLTLLRILDLLSGPVKKKKEHFKWHFQLYQRMIYFLIKITTPTTKMGVPQPRNVGGYLSHSQ